ncbi:hypothetical protein Tco_1161062 [Tanacetum coccineum]
MDNSFTLGSNEEANHVKILQSCNGLLLCSGLRSHVFYYVYNPSTNLFKRLLQLENSHDDSLLHATGVLRMTFDPTKSRNYKGCNFLHAHILTLKFKFTLERQAIGAYIPGILHLQGRLFESRGCLLLACRDDIDSKDFTIYEMVKECSVWTVRMGRGFFFGNQFGNVVKYNIISKTISQIFKIGSNQMDDDYEFFPLYTVAHNPYEFIPSFASV